MILSRIAKALKDQNWLAVAIEFVIVIAGVVIGFQVTAWNEDRLSAIRGAELSERLVADLRDEQWRVAATRNYLIDVAAIGERTLAALEGETEISDEALVIGAYRATQYFWSGLIRGTYDEIVASGEIGLISNTALRDSAVEYYGSSPTALLIELGETPFRNAIRERIDPELHRDLVADCTEDVNIQIGDYAAIEAILDFPCRIEGHDAAITRLATELRGSQDLTNLLRRRVIEAAQQSNSIQYYGRLLETALAADPGIDTTP
jgi:hypothetical protein